MNKNKDKLRLLQQPVIEYPGCKIRNIYMENLTIENK